jgi:hypothetical protein
VENLLEDGEWAVLEWSGGATWSGEFAGLERTADRSICAGAGSFASLVARSSTSADTGTRQLGSTNSEFHSDSRTDAVPQGLAAEAQDVRWMQD